MPSEMLVLLDHREFRDNQLILTCEQPVGPVQTGQVLSDAIGGEWRIAFVEPVQGRPGTIRVYLDRTDNLTELYVGPGTPDIQFHPRPGPPPPPPTPHVPITYNVAALLNATATLDDGTELYPLKIKLTAKFVDSAHLFPTATLTGYLVTLIDASLAPTATLTADLTLIPASGNILAADDGNYLLTDGGTLIIAG